MSTTQVRVEIAADTRPYERSMDRAATATGKVEKGQRQLNDQSRRSPALWAAVGGAVTLAGAKVVGQLKACTDAASDLNESVSKMRVIFGTASKDVEAFASTSAQSLGMSKKAAYDAASTFATFGKAAGLAGGELSKFSTDMVGLSADLASFFNSSPEEAIESIGAALRGESEPIRKYGVLLDDATLKAKAFEMGLISSIKAGLTPQQKALAAQAEILDQTADAQGDFARTGDGLANSQRKMSAAIEDAQAAFGEALLPTLTKATKGVTGVVEAFSDLPGPAKDAIAVAAAALGALALGGPAVAGAMKGVGAIRDAMKALQGTAAGVRVAQALAPLEGAAKSMTLARGAAVGMLGPIGLATAAVAGMAVAGRKLSDAMIDKRMDALTESMKEARIAGKHLDDTLALTITRAKSSADAAAGTMAGALSGMGSKSYTPNVGMDPGVVRETVTGIKRIADETKGATAAAREAKAQFAVMDATLAAMDPQAAALEYAHLVEQMEAQGGSAKDLNALLPTYIDKMRESKAAAADAAAGQKSLSEATKAVADEATKAKDALFNYLNAQLAMEGSADALIGAQDRLAEAVKKNGKAVAGNSKGALANRDALRQEAAAIATNAQAVNDKAIADGKTAPQALAKARKAIEDGRDALIRSARQAGLSKEAATKYINELLRIPKKTDTEIKADASLLEAKVAEAKRKLADPKLTDPEKSKLRADIKDLEAKVAAANRKLGTVPKDKRVTVTVAGVGSIDTAADKASKLLGTLNKLNGMKARYSVSGGYSGGAGGGGGGPAPGPSKSGYTRPAQGPSSGNWARYVGGRRAGQWHGGADIGARAGSAVRASSTQLVKRVLYLDNSYGHHVVSTDGRHDFVYAHMNSIFVSPGRVVQRGNRIGTVGSTGNSDGAHLHYEVRPAGRGNGSAINPYNFMAAGGRVRGAGTATSDSIPTMLSDGEYVVRAAAVDAWGEDFLDAVNAMGGMKKGGKASKKKRPSGPSVADIVEDAEWQYDMGLIGLGQKLAIIAGQLGRLKEGSADWKALKLTIHQIEGEMAESAASTAAAATTAAEEAARIQQEAAAEAARIQEAAAAEAARIAEEAAAEAARIAAEAEAARQAARDRRDSYASGIATGLIGQSQFGQTREDGKAWGVSSTLANFASRAAKLSAFASVVQGLTTRGLSREVVQQVVAAGPEAGMGMARALAAMSDPQLATVNASQNQIASTAAGLGAFLGNAFLGVPGENVVRVEVGGSQPIQLTLDSRTVYQGLLELQRQQGGSLAFVSRQ